MRKIWKYLRQNKRLIIIAVLVLAVLCGLLLYKLGSLTGGLSSGEAAVAVKPLGWHGIYHQPFNLPLNFVRSAVFFVFPDHGQTLTRLPDVLFGALSIISFAWLVRLWHGRRTAAMATALFATSAWTLHVSRLASFDVLYLWALPTLLLSCYAVQRYNKKPLVLYLSLAAWGLLLYLPGLVWLVLIGVFWQRQAIIKSLGNLGHWWQYILCFLAGFIWLPLLVLNLTRPGNLRLWLGLPAHLATPLHLAKEFTAVFVHLFVRGPQYPDLWLGRLPVLDVFTLAACLIGIYFYARHWQAGRSRVLAALLFAGAVLVGLGGPVSLSLLVPLLYIIAATGIAYLLREWLQVFPINPLARGLGIGLIIAVVAASCLYNVRAYFIAWPHNAVTQATFRYYRH